MATFLDRRHRAGFAFLKVALTARGRRGAGPVCQGCTPFGRVPVGVVLYVVLGLYGGPGHV